MQRAGLLSGGACVDINSRLQSSDVMHAGVIERGDNPNREVDKCGDTNLSI